MKSHQYVGYTSVYNVLDWAALAIPVTTVSKALDQPVPQDWQTHQGRNASDEFNKNQCEFEKTPCSIAQCSVTCMIAAVTDR